MRPHWSDDFELTRACFPDKFPSSTYAAKQANREAARARDVDLEGLSSRKTKDDLNETDGDADFAALHRLVNNTRLPEDEDLRALRKLVNDHHQRRLHAALDRALERLEKRRGWR